MWLYLMLYSLLIVVLYLLAIMPNVWGNKDFTPFLNRHYAHRGLFDSSKGVPENSIDAFRKAVAAGYGIELDVQLTRDKIPVVIHDYDLLRACGKNIKVNKLTYKELQQHQLFDTMEIIPRFTDVLAVVNGKVPLIIELKVEKRDVSVCAEVISILENYEGKYCIESFNPFVLIWLRWHWPSIIRGQLSSDFRKEKTKGNQFLLFIMKSLLLNFLTQPDFIAFNHRYKSSLSFQICRKIYKVKTFAWTIRSKEEFKRNKRSFDLYIFDSFIPD